MKYPCLMFTDYIAFLCLHYCHVSKLLILESFVVSHFIYLSIYGIFYIHYRHIHFFALCFIMLHRCSIFHNLKAKLSTSKKTVTPFIVTLTLLQRSGTKPAIFLRYACIDNVYIKFTCNL